MRPRERRDSGQNDLFKARLDQIVDLDHALAKLGRAIDWGFLEGRFGAVYSDKAGHPPLPTRLMAGLSILKHMHDLSDEDLCARWVENPYYQLFCGEEVFQHKLTFDRSSLTRWRQRMGEERLVALIQESLSVATRTGAAKPADFSKVIVDTTVQPKAVAFPTDAKLMHRARERLAKLAKKTGVELRQSYLRVGKHALIAHQRYAHAKQFKRANRALRTIRTYLGRVTRDIVRKIKGDAALESVFAHPLMLAKIRRDGRVYANFSVADKLDLLAAIADRRIHDRVDWNAFTKGAKTPADKKARKLLDDALADYQAGLVLRGMVDFTQLEQAVLTRLRVGGFKDVTDELAVLLVDEYQDTNLLQQEIYFELAKRCGGALTVVGDDDQSLYRFRGATVDLFTKFDSNYAKAFNVAPKKIFLNENYRSTATIIRFVNDFGELDGEYQTVRVADKPTLLNPTASTPEFPILGMFRESLDELAEDLAAFIHDVTRGMGRKIGSQVLKVAPKVGDVGDCALLCSSPREYGSSTFGPARARLPLRLKQALGGLDPQISIFNPRGQEFAEISQVRRFGGLLLMCVDPLAEAEDLVARALGQAVRSTFQTWSNETSAWLRSAKCPEGLKDFVDRWGKRDPGRAGYRWPTNVSCIDLLYALVHWMPELYDDPEGQVYLEVFTRQLGAAEQVSTFKARIVTDSSNKDLSNRSVAHLLLYFLSPIASGAAKVEEELFESFPRDRLNVLSIHQSKGLQFPLVIVDVGSDFPRAAKMPYGHPGHAFKRFPQKPDTPEHLEDLLREFSPLGEPTRSGVNRAFDDLYRQFFVAFSRPQDVLLLVGLNASKPGIGTIRNVATGCDRNGINKWLPTLPFSDI